MQDPSEIIAKIEPTVDARQRCQGDGLDDRDETLAVDRATGEYYWVCPFCRGVVRPAAGHP